MKKVLLATLVSSVMSVSAMAVTYEGKVTTIKTYNNGNIAVFVQTAADGVRGGQLDPANAEARKSMYAAALTARTAGITVDLSKNGDYVNAIILK